MPAPKINPGIVFMLFLSILLNSNDAIGQCWKQIFTGTGHIMAIKSDGTLWGWGGNSGAHLGIGNTISPQKVVQIGTDNTWDTIIPCQNSTIARKTDGSYWGWGFNHDGELGIGNYTTQPVPVQVAPPGVWRSILPSIGAYYIGIKQDGTLWSWGDNGRGNLGIGVTAMDPTSPVLMSTATDWKKVSCGWTHVMAVKTDGTLWGWGNNSYKELSNTIAAEMQFTPVQIGTATDWADVSAGESFTIALKTDGTLWAWGKNDVAQLGVGDRAQHLTGPLQVGTANDWTAVVTGAEHTIAIKPDHSLWAWGNNSSRALGYATTNFQTTPAPLGIGNVSWKSFCLGYQYTLVLKTDETVWASGNNDWALLGNGVAGTDIPVFTKAGLINYNPYVPALGGGTEVLSRLSCDTSFTGYHSFGNTSHPKMLAILTKNNTGDFTVTYDSSRNTNSSPLVQSNATHATSLMGRLVTVTYSGTISNGVTVRFYYNATDSTNASNALNAWISAHPGTVKQWAWIKYEGDAAALVSNQQPNGFTGTSGIYRSLMAFENGVRFRDFKDLTSFSTFGGFAYANLTNTPFVFVLPITIRYFTAYPQGTTAVLKWTTASEADNNGFTIERSDNSLNWQTIGYLPTQAPGGNSVADINYSYSDNNPAKGTNYYRLKQEDKHGKASFSRIVSVTFHGDNVTRVFPNPAKNVFYISGMNGGETVSIYTVFGQLLRSEKIPGKGTYPLSIEGLPKGVYVVKVDKQTTGTKVFNLLAW